MSATTIMAGGFALQGVNALVGGIMQSQAIGAQADYTIQQLEWRQEIASMRAEDAVERGEEMASMVRRAGRQLIGRQRSSVAAQSIDVNAGSARQAQIDTKYFTELESIAVRNNAWRESWGYKVGAMSLESEAAFTKVAAGFRQDAALFSGIGKLTSGALGAAYAYSLGQKTPEPPPAPILPMSASRGLPAQFSGNPAGLLVGGS